MRENGAIVYRYSVSNGATAKQAIIHIMLDQIVNPVIGELPFPHRSTDMEAFNAFSAAVKTALATPGGWDGDITRLRSDNLDRIAWMPHSDNLNTNGIQAGRTLTGFGFSSLDLPGVGPTLTAGLGEVFGFPDEGPVEDSAVLDELNRLRDNHFVLRPAAVPMIAVPNPFDAAVLLDRIQTQMHTWIDKQLLDATFSSQLDRFFASAISAYRLNQPKVGKKQIQTMREMLNKEHQDLGRDEEHESDKTHEKNDGRKSALIDRLAARVLDFDLEYVTKRMDGDNREHASTDTLKPAPSSSERQHKK